MNPLPQNLFPSFGTQSGRFFSPARLMCLQGPGSISVPHHSVVRGHSCRTFQGVCAPGVIPRNNEAPLEPGVSSLLLLTSSTPVFPLPSHICLSSLFSPQSHPTHRLCSRSKLSLPLPHLFSVETFCMFAHTIPSPFLPLHHSLTQHPSPGFCQVLAEC